MIEAVNILLALATIGFGALAFFWPNFALKALKLQTAAGYEDGKSEIRAASGGAFMGTGAAALVLGSTTIMGAAATPFAWLMLGAHYAGAGIGRLMSFANDGSGSAKMWAFFASEALFAAWLIGANWPF